MGAEVGKHLTYRLEFDACVNKRLDDSKLEKILIAVPAPGAATRSVGKRRPYEIGSGPVIELSVTDADDFGSLAAAETLS